MTWVAWHRRRSERARAPCRPRVRAALTMREAACRCCSPRATRLPALLNWLSVKAHGVGFVYPYGGRDISRIPYYWGCACGCAPTTRVSCVCGRTLDPRERHRVSPIPGDLLGSPKGRTPQRREQTLRSTFSKRGARRTGTHRTSRTPRTLQPGKPVTSPPSTQVTQSHKQKGRQQREGPSVTRRGSPWHGGGKG